MRSVQLRVGSDVSICVMEIGWHDKQGQHGCVLDQMCLYEPIQICELLRMKLRWQDRRVQYGCVLGRTCLYAPWILGGMTDEVSKVACWIGCVNIY